MHVTNGNEGYNIGDGWAVGDGFWVLGDWVLGDGALCGTSSLRRSAITNTQHLTPTPYRPKACRRAPLARLRTASRDFGRFLPARLM